MSRVELPAAFPPPAASLREGAGLRVVAVMGTGSIGVGHLKALGRLARVAPLAIPVRAQRVEELRARGCQAVSTLQEASSEGARLGVIATETNRHVPDGLAAIRLGWDLLVEKPLARSAPEARQLAAEARRAGRWLIVGCVLRHADSLKAFREQLPRVGALHTVRIECQSYLPDWRPTRPYRESYSARADDGGVLRDLIHEVDYAGWLFGWPASLHARVDNLGRLGIEAEESADLWWQAPGGYGVSIHLDYLTTPSRRRLVACGEHGTITWDGVAQTVAVAVAGQAEDHVRRYPQTRDDMLMAQARAFLDAGEGQPSDSLATAEDGVKALAVCDAARRASQERREMVVAYP